jgi:uncharacterized membrane protein YfcA
MDYVVLIAVAFGASLLTFFTGFGLGTILLPAFALFFPPEVAVGLTAVVHLANNLFKLALVGRHASLPVALRFGLPAIPAALAGAWLLGWLSGLPPVATWSAGTRTFLVTPVGLAVGALLLGFAGFDLWPWGERLAIPSRWLPAGGLLSGFFGGLSGHQGALRSAFLVRAGLPKEAFIATGVVCAVAVDLTRLPVYADRFLARSVADAAPLLVCAVLAAFSGALLGRRLLRQTSFRAIEIAVAVLLAAVALGLASGLL